MNDATSDELRGMAQPDENGDVWVYDGDQRYTVFRAGLTHSTADSAFPRTAAGRSLAIARTDYLARRQHSR